MSRTRHKERGKKKKRILQRKSVDSRRARKVSVEFRLGRGVGKFEQREKKQGTFKQ